jgi:hypothetical protein
MTDSPVAALSKFQWFRIVSSLRANPRRASTINPHIEDIILTEEKNKPHSDESGRNMVRGRGLVPCTEHSYKLLGLARSMQSQLPARYETLHSGINDEVERLALIPGMRDQKYWMNIAVNCFRNERLGRVSDRAIEAKSAGP